MYEAATTKDYTIIDGWLNCHLGIEVKGSVNMASSEKE
jgi:hypothetical protein